jgi:hypothetical protein
MDKGILEQVSRHVAKKFPEMVGVRPTIRRQGKSSSDDPCFVLTFKGKAELPGGRKISRIVRVVADDSGRIIRMSTSK